VKAIPKITTPRQAAIKRNFVELVDKKGVQNFPQDIQENYQRTVKQLEKWDKAHSTP